MIRVDVSKCTGCKRCESVCAFFHTGRVNNRLARIRVLNLYEIGIDGPVVCNQCLERYCMNCPADALTIGALGQVIVSPVVCTLCGTCEQSCPIGAINIFNDIVYVCDLCGGRPKCVAACTEGAIRFASEEEHPSLAILKKEAGEANPSQRRYYYLKKQGLNVRKSWRKEHA